MLFTFVEKKKEKKKLCYLLNYYTTHKQLNDVAIKIITLNINLFIYFFFFFFNFNFNFFTSL
jgi:hypothetical protein